MSIERVLFGEIPMAEAAAFFIKLKTASPKQQQQQQQEKTAAKLKEGTEWMYSPRMRAVFEGLPEKSFEVEETKVASDPKERAHAALATSHEKHKATSGERAGSLAGKIVGTVAGGAAGHTLSRHLHGVSPGANAAMLLGGAALGHTMGGSVGKDAGKSIDARSKLASVIKLAFDEPPSLEQYVADERKGDAAAQVNESAYFRQRSQELQQQAAMAQEQLGQTQQQMAQMQQQIDTSNSQMQQVMQQAQMTQAAALAQSQAAHQAATQATQQALSAQDTALQEQQLAARMRMAFQEMRGNIMGVVSQDPAADVGQALQSQGQEVPNSPPQQGGLAPGGSQENAAVGAENAPDAQTAPGSPAPAGADQNAEAAHPNEQNPDMPSGMTEVKTSAAEEQKPVEEKKPLEGSAGLKQKVESLDGDSEKGFGKAFSMAQAKAQLALAEGEEHPEATALMGSLLDANAGSKAASALRKIPRNLKHLLQ